MRSGAIVALLLALSLACGDGGFFRQYEYEEETYLSLDGTATMYVNSSVPALNDLRGARFDTDPDATIEKSAVADFFNGPSTRVTRVTFSHRNGRLYLHVRMSVDDVRELGRTKPFAWSTYAFSQDGDLMVYRQRVGAPAAVAQDAGTWTGDELVAFRVHIPSKVGYHNAGPDNLKRGNILVWEQSLADRLAGAPLDLDARLEMQSILYRTLGIFAITIVAVAATFAAILWWIVRGQPRTESAPHIRRAS
jgi:hypothetical protein